RQHSVPPQGSGVGFKAHDASINPKISPHPCQFSLTAWGEALNRRAAIIARVRGADRASPEEVAMKVTITSLQ
ncbi:MAG: hypothetical protein WA709_23625, partial [Stellaceae bacterium]